MADFFTDLWTSVFTPGPTPTLLIATNATFAALQLVLLALLVATYSVHFVILSFLCAGLWWSINWFAAEVLRAQAEGEEKERAARGKGKRGAKEWRRSGEVGDSADDEGEETEVEGEVMVDGKGGEKKGGLGDEGGLATGARRSGAGSGLRQRAVEELDRSGEVSTDSEWEKVSAQGDA